MVYTPRTATERRGPNSPDSTLQTRRGLPQTVESAALGGGAWGVRQAAGGGGGGAGT